jgi:hypothetical protein
MRSSHVGCTPHTELSLSAQRPLSDWLVHLFDQRLATPAECSRPTGFGGPPLLPGYPDLLRPAPAFTTAEIRR